MSAVVFHNMPRCQRTSHGFGGVSVLFSGSRGGFKGLKIQIRLQRKNMWKHLAFF